jgi:predicted acyl esterase
MLIERDVPIPTRDGLVLRCDVFRPPAAPAPVPVIMSMGPYAKALPFQEGFRERWERLLGEHPDVLDGSTGRHANWETVDPEQWVPAGYACVRVDSRGAGRSPGVLDLWSAREAADFYDAIEWAGGQPWSSGRVGLCGISYYAINQWQVAALRPPHLAAILPWEGAADHYRDMTRHGGILSNGFFDGWYPRQVLSVQHGRGEAGARSSWVDDGLVSGPPTVSPGELSANRADYLAGIRAHPLDDEWHRSRTADLSRIEVPLLSAANWGGLGLHSRGNFEGFSRAGSPQRWLEVHTGRHEEAFYTAEGRDLQRKFFDFTLKGRDTGWGGQPPVWLTIRHAGGGLARRAEGEWPLARTRWEPWFLDAAGLSLTPARPAEHSTGVSFHTGDAELTFTSPPLAAPLELTGPAAANLVVATTGTDGDLFLTLRAFAPDGSEVTFKGANDPRAPLSQGWLRISHRDLDPGMSRPWRPWHHHREVRPARPGEAHELAVELWPTCVVLPAGYRLALTVAGRDFARPDDGGPFRGSGPFRHDDPADRPPAATLTVHSGGRAPSHLLLPVIPG